MGNKCRTPKATPVIECIQELQKVEKTLHNLIDKYTKTRANENGTRQNVQQTRRHMQPILITALPPLSHLSFPLALSSLTFLFRHHHLGSLHLSLAVW